MTAVSTTTLAVTLDAPPCAIRSERSTDVAARERLLDLCFGANRHARTCQRLRDGRLPAEGLAFVSVHQGRLVGTLRLWRVSAGGKPALVLGPLAVDPACQSLGIGAALVRHALKVATALGHGAVILLGDAAYYQRFGFSTVQTAGLALPGPFERERLLALELKARALEGANGLIVATGTRASAMRRPDFAGAA